MSYVRLAIMVSCIGESRKGRKVDALAHGGDEGRDKLRQALGRCK